MATVTWNMKLRGVPAYSTASMTKYEIARLGLSDIQLVCFFIRITFFYDCSALRHPPLFRHAIDTWTVHSYPAHMIFLRHWRFIGLSLFLD